MDRRFALLLLVSAVLLGADWKSFMSPGVLARAHDPIAGDCDQCHLVFDGVPNAKCLDCHDAVQERITLERGFHAKHASAPCVECHPDHGGLDSSLTTPEAKADFDHVETTFPIQGGHLGLLCADCHTGPLEKMGASCAGCHEDRHGGQLGDDCGTCHSDRSWTEGLKTLDAHELSMTGKHGALGCPDCHQVGLHLAEVVLCADCHERGHGGTAAPCDQCHQVSGWKPAEFDHGPCTCAFPGKHQTVPCLDCHADFVFADTPTRCGACHEADRKHDPLGECARCHTAVAWSDSTFDHDTKTKFAITGEHQAVSCTQCHAQAGVFSGQLAACASCHADDGEQAHGDFGACERCHTTAGFRPSTFDHASTGFPLTGKHAGAPCQECHREKVKGYPN